MFPKLAAVALLVIAAIAAVRGGQPLALTIATAAAAVCLLGSFSTRWAAVPGLLVAAAGVLLVFASYVQMSDGVTWDQAIAMVAYGLAMIATLMILVERKERSMRVIVIGAGRGRRLMPTTADAPKCFAEVAGKRLHRLGPRGVFAPTA